MWKRITPLLRNANANAANITHSRNQLNVITFCFGVIKGNAAACETNKTFNDALTSLSYEIFKYGAEITSYAHLISNGASCKVI